jgi:hypothetical protein
MVAMVSPDGIFYFVFDAALPRLHPSYSKKRLRAFFFVRMDVCGFSMRIGKLA